MKKQSVQVSKLTQTEHVVVKHYKTGLNSNLQAERTVSGNGRLLLKASR